MRVELIFMRDCPNVDDARARLERAFAELGAPSQWQEWDRDDPASPQYASAYGSPTILVDGKDVANALPSEAANCCRLYRDAEGRFQGVPSVEQIASALRRVAWPDCPALSAGSQSPHGKGRQAAQGTLRAVAPGGPRSWLAVLPAVGVALMPKFICPACWPVYTGLLGSLGLPFLTETKYQLPLTTAFLVIAVGALGFRAKKRRGYAPFGLGVFAAGLVMVGKFLLNFTPALYGGIAILIAASLWNSWPRKPAVLWSDSGGPCPACAPAGSLDNLGSTQEEI